MCASAIFPVRIGSSPVTSVCASWEPCSYSTSNGYSAYGNTNTALTKTAAGVPTGLNSYRYTGKRLDIASNTLDMGARRFNRSTSRFLQYDYYDGALANLGLSLHPLSSNRYALAGGNPVNYVEADGHMLLPDDIGGVSPADLPTQTVPSDAPPGEVAGPRPRVPRSSTGSRMSSAAS